MKKIKIINFHSFYYFSSLADYLNCDTDICVGLSSGTAGLYVDGHTKEIGKSVITVFIELNIL
jgi:hypothetical protein